MESVQGRSLVPILKGDTDAHREFVYSEYLEDNIAMVRTSKWKYFITSGKHDLVLGYATGAGAAGSFEGLYNLELDPNEFQNLATDPAHAATLSRMRSRMLWRFRETHPLAFRVPSELTMMEKIEWFLEPLEKREKYINYQTLNRD